MGLCVLSFRGTRRDVEHHDKSRLDEVALHEAADPTTYGLRARPPPDAGWAGELHSERQRNEVDMSAFEILVPYRLQNVAKSLSMRVTARSVEEAFQVARNRAMAVRPLLGGTLVQFPGEVPEPILAPYRAA